MIMKSCKTIIGTVIIEIEKGTGLGEIHQVLVDEGMLLSNHPLTFVVKSNQPDQPYALLPGRNIHGIGDFAVMVENSSALQDIDEAALKVLNDKQGAVFDEMVITIDGNKIGRVVDYHIDDQHEIGFLIVQPEDASADIQIPKSRILMVGKEYIILNEEKAMSVVAESPVPVRQEAASPVLEVVEPSPVVEEAPVVAEEVSAPVQEESLLAEAAPVAPLAEAPIEPAVEVVEPVAEVVAEPSPVAEPVVEDSSDFEPLVQETPQEAPVAASPAAQVESSKPASFEEVLGDDNFDLDAMLAELYAKPALEPSPAPQAAVAEPAAQAVVEPVVEAVAPVAEPVAEVVAPVAEAVVEPVAPVAPVAQEVAEPAETGRKMSLEEAFASIPSVKQDEFSAKTPEKPAEKVETASTKRVVPITYLNNEGSTFLNEQKRLLLGKKLQKDLVSTDGNTVLYSGDTVTDETIDLLRRIDRKLLVRLAECVV
ncbi:PRC-barrel domain-containing protein [Streptococcus oricebi]|uniref:PRC-barrel domain-containing protein n=1 Tax=Streptococcus oricebi TaxID=1547447 RepID=A0ABS5B5T7_9STRE|nr:hypothetical protein [Streptococcus oricebi]MBP2624190.1 hypothetical protein [Streptococcus oricebi]